MKALAWLVWYAAWACLTWQFYKASHAAGLVFAVAGFLGIVGDACRHFGRARRLPRTDSRAIPVPGRSTARSKQCR